MRIITLFIVYFAVCFALKAQSDWNYLLPMTPFESYTMSANPGKDKFIVCGTGFDTINRQCIIYALLDTIGNLERVVYRVDTGEVRSSYDTWYGGMIATKDEKFLTSFTTQRRNNSVLKLNQDLSVNFYSEFKRDTLTEFSNFDMTAKETSQGYALFGSIGMVGSVANQGQIRMLDYFGQQKWYKKFDYGPYGERVLDVVELNDSTLLAGTVEGVVPSNISTPQQGRTGFYEIDANTGEVVQEWQSAPLPDIGYMRKIMVLDDSTYLMYGLVHRGWFGTYVFVTNMLTVMNKNFEIIKQDSISPITGLGSHWEIENWKRTNDGDVIAVGGDVNADTTRAGGKVFKFNPYTLEKKWEAKVYTPLVPSEYEDGKLYDFDTLSSGNIIAVGVARDTFSRYTWVVKVTKDGCIDTTFCQTISTDNIFTFPNGLNVKTSPNPCNQMIAIEASASTWSAHTRIQIFDLVGRLVYESTGFEGRKQIDTSALNNGHYLIVLRNGDLSATGKFVVQH